MPRVEKFEEECPLHTYKCKKKHEYKDFGPWAINISYEGTKVSSGPLCPFCYMAWLGKQFGSKEVV